MIFCCTYCSRWELQAYLLNKIIITHYSPIAACAPREHSFSSLNYSKKGFLYDYWCELYAVCCMTTRLKKKTRRKRNNVPTIVQENFLCYCCSFHSTIVLPPLENTISLLNNCCWCYAYVFLIEQRHDDANNKRDWEKSLSTKKAGMKICTRSFFLILLSRRSRRT